MSQQMENIVTEGELISEYGARSSDVVGASSAFTIRSGNTTGGSALTTGSLTLQSGNGSGTNTSSGNVVLDAGSVSGTGTAGQLLIGTTNTSVISLGRTGVTTTNNGALTVTQDLTASADLIVDTDTLFVDSFNNRVGIGTDTPGTDFDVRGTAADVVNGTSSYFKGTLDSTTSSNTNTLRVTSTASPSSASTLNYIGAFCS